MLQKVSEAKRKATMQVDRDSLYKKENLKLKMKEENIKKQRDDEYNKTKVYSPIIIFIYIIEI